MRSSATAPSLRVVFLFEATLLCHSRCRKARKKVERKTQNERLRTSEGYACNVSTHAETHTSDGIGISKCIGFSKLPTLLRLHPWKVHHVRQVKSIPNTTPMWFTYYSSLPFLFLRSRWLEKHVVISRCFFLLRSFLSFARGWVEVKRRVFAIDFGQIKIKSNVLCLDYKGERKKGSDHLLFGDDCRPVMRKNQYLFFSVRRKGSRRGARFFPIS